MTDLAAGAATLAAPTPTTTVDVTGELSAPISMRWPHEVLARADAAAARTGLNRSAVLRLAVLEGLPAVERLGQ